MRVVVVSVLVVAGVFAGCVGSPDPAVDSGWLEARWTGADTGNMSAPTTAEWCAQDRLLELRAIQGDTGLAMVLYPLDTVDTDTYQVVRPEGADSLAPSAGVALRMFLSNAVQGYQGDSGTVVLDRASSGKLSGTMQARARSVVNGQVLTLTGELRDVSVVPQALGCGLPAPIETADSGAEPSGTDVD